MLLSELLQQANLADLAVTGSQDVMIRDIATDSREVKEGALFVAVPGTKHNGAQFVPAALKAGAAAIMIAERVVLDMPATVPIIRVKAVRESVAKLASCFYTPQSKYLVGVTGTDGKTSVANFAAQLFTLSGHAAASIGTLGLVCDNKLLSEAFPKVNTSPDPVLLHRTLLNLAAQKIEHVALEVSSHGLAQHRADGVAFKAAAFTNITRDHLDYHGTEEAYFNAKKRLFSEVLKEGSTAVINADDARVASLKSLCESRNITVKTFGKTGDDYQIMSVQPGAEGLDATIQIEGAKYQISLPLYGSFQLYNVLAAAGLVAACGVDITQLLKHFSQLQPVKGRMELVTKTDSGARCFVDYAHTPAALETVLTTMRAHTEGKLRVVFGCGGERDQGKRPQMGEVAERLADDVIVTDDNPRNEDAASIRKAILETANGATEIADRSEAIHAAVRDLEKNDVLLIAGKGHEDYQIIGEQKQAFDDATTIKRAVGIST